jgi:hypothetical protein
VHWFQSHEDAQQKSDAFGRDYNEHHPHRALKGLSPGEYARRVMTTTAVRLAVITDRKIPQNRRNSQSMRSGNWGTS